MHASQILLRKKKLFWLRSCLKIAFITTAAYK